MAAIFSLELIKKFKTFEAIKANSLNRKIFKLIDAVIQ